MWSNSGNRKQQINLNSMKTIIHSLTSKYLVNVILIFLFSASSVTGIFHVGGEGHERNHHFKTDQTVSTNTSSAQLAGFSEKNEADYSDADSRQEGEENEFHIYSGLFWILLMIFHIVHNWSWFRKITTVKHILNNKLTTLITVVFILLAVSGILLWIGIKPDKLFSVKEIHDVSGKLLFALIIIHVIQRFKWYITIPRVLLKRIAIANQTNTNQK